MPISWQSRIERWVVVCVCAAGLVRKESRVAVDAASVDSAGNGVYNVRLRETSWEVGGQKHMGSLQIGLQNHPFDRKFWQASLDCANQRLRVGVPAFFNGAAPVPGSETESAPRGEWLSASTPERGRDLLQAFCSFRWKKD